MDLVDGLGAVPDRSHRHCAVDRFDHLARPDRAESAAQLDELHAVADQLLGDLEDVLRARDADGHGPAGAGVLGGEPSPDGLPAAV